MPNDVSILGPESTLLHAANASGAVNVRTLRQVNVSLCCDSFCERCVIHGSDPLQQTVIFRSVGWGRSEKAPCACGTGIRDCFLPSFPTPQTSALSTSQRGCRQRSARHHRNCAFFRSVHFSFLHSEKYVYKSQRSQWGHRLNFRFVCDTSFVCFQYTACRRNPLVSTLGT